MKESSAGKSLSFLSGCSLSGEIQYHVFKKRQTSDSWTMDDRTDTNSAAQNAWMTEQIPIFYSAAQNACMTEQIPIAPLRMHG